jgi:hypothetical protein
MTTKKNVGTRTKPSVRTPEEQRKHRAEQAARAIAAGRGDRHTNWLRIERHLRDVPGKVGFFAGLAIPEAIQESVWPTPPPSEENPAETVVEETVEEIGVLVTDPIFGEVLEIEMSQDDIPPVEPVA